MKRLLLSLCCVVLCLSALAQARDKKAVANCYAQYIEALKDDNGNKAVALLSQKSVDYFADVLTKCKTLDSTQIEELTLIDKLMVLLIKIRAGKDKIVSMNTGKELLIYAVNNGMVGKQSIDRASIGAVTIEDSFAKAVFVVDGQESPYFLHFYKEGGKWLFDLMHNLTLGRPVMQQAIDQTGMTETEFVMTILENLNGEKPSPEIWQPFQ